MALSINSLTFSVERVIAPGYHKEREKGKEKKKDTQKKTQNTNTI